MNYIAHKHMMLHPTRSLWDTHAPLTTATILHVLLQSTYYDSNRKTNEECSVYWELFLVVVNTEEDEEVFFFY